jgi:hypothetical protein
MLVSGVVTLQTGLFECGVVAVLLVFSAAQ